MANQRLIDWLKVNKNKGYTYDQLKNILLDNGYNKDEINEAIEIVSNRNTKNRVKQNTGNNGISKKWLILFGIIILISTSILFYNNFLSGYLETSPQKQNCSEIRGSICSSNQVCEGQRIETFDTSSCCLGGCKKNTKIKNCGTIFLDSESLNTKNYNNDSTMICLGNSLLGNCRKSRAIFNTSNYGKIKVEVENSNKGGQCRFSVEYGNSEQIQTDSKKKYSNKYIECPELELIKTLSPQAEKESHLSESPGTYAFMAYFSMRRIVKNPEVLDLDQISEIGCTGTLLKYFKNKANNASIDTSQKDNEIPKGEKGFCSSSSDRDKVVRLEGDVVYCDNNLRMWTITVDKKYEWEEAKDFCNKLNYGGYSDWKLPSCKSGDNLPSSCVLYQFGESICGWTGETKESNPCIPSWDSNAAHNESYWSSTLANEQYELKYANIVPYDTSYKPSSFTELSSLYVRCLRQ